MYALIETGGKQYRVAKDEVITIEKLDAVEGDTVTFENVLFISKDGQVQVGSPLIANAKVTAKVVKNGRSKKITVFKYKPKKNYKKKQGHRQPFSRVVIENIEV